MAKLHLFCTLETKTIRGHARRKQNEYWVKTVTLQNIAFHGLTPTSELFATSATIWICTSRWNVPSISLTCKKISEAMKACPTSRWTFCIAIWSRLRVNTYRRSQNLNALLTKARPSFHPSVETNKKASFFAKSILNIFNKQNRKTKPPSFRLYTNRPANGASTTSSKLKTCSPGIGGLQRPWRCLARIKELKTVFVVVCQNYKIEA